MPTLVEDIVSVRKSQPRIDLIMVAVGALVDRFPQFAVDSIIASDHLTKWTASSVYNAAEKRGVVLSKASRANKVSLSTELAKVFFDPSVSDADLLELRQLMADVRESLETPIYLEDETEAEVDEDPLA